MLILSEKDKTSLSWIEWWMSHHERGGRLGSTLQSALEQVRDMMERFDIPGIPLDAQDNTDPMRRKRPRKE